MTNQNEITLPHFLRLWTRKKRRSGESPAYMIIDNSERPMRKAHNVFLSSPTIHYTTQKKHGLLTFSKKKGRRRRRSTDSDWPLSVFLLFENLPAAAMAAARLLPLLRRRLAAVISDSPVPSSRGIWIHQLLYPSPTVSLSQNISVAGFYQVVCASTPAPRAERFMGAGFSDQSIGGSWVPCATPFIKLQVYA